MEKLIKLIEEYGKLENELGFKVGFNKGKQTQEITELRKNRTEKYIELHTEILKLNKKLLEKEI